MERWRWMPRDLGDGYVVTNVPEYLTRVVRNGTVIATHKAVVGKPSTPTPQLNPMATGVILNPTWPLPRHIARKSLGKGKRLSVRVDLGGRRTIKKKNKT